LPSIDPQIAVTPQVLIDRARLARVKVWDLRIDAGDRGFPAYLDSKRFLSNVPATTAFFPVVDLSHQYINGPMYDTAEGTPADACGPPSLPTLWVSGKPFRDRSTGMT
jgi:hypothetical protein